MASINWDFPLALGPVAAVDLSDLLVVFGAMLFTGGAITLVMLVGSLRPERRTKAALPQHSKAALPQHAQAALPPAPVRIPEERISPEWRRLDHDRPRPYGMNRTRPADAVTFSDPVKPFKKHEADGGLGNRSGA